MMLAIVKEIIIAANPGRVFSALTQQDEIARWWTNDLSIRPEIGSLAEFRFRQGAFVLQFEIAELDANENVAWQSRSGPAGWSGTCVTWQITTAEKGGAKLVFTHDGFTQADQLYKQTRGNWDYFLASLKSYLETGRGTPGTPPYPS